MRNLLAVAAICLLAVPSSAATLSGSLNLGGATATPDRFSVSGNSVQSAPMAQLQIKVNNLVGPLNFSAEVRHAFCDSDKRELYNKSRYCLGVEMPVAMGVFAFCNYERYYRQNDDWAWAGVSLRF